MPIQRSKIDEIRNANSLTSLLNEYGVELSPSGVRLKGLCPMHNERSPSFYVNPSTNTYKCFGCGEGGDAIALIQNLESLSFVGAVEFLADKAGIIIDRSEEEDETFKKRKLIYNVLKETAQWYEYQFNNLDESHKAKEELRRRNLYSVNRDSKWLHNNGIGYAPDGWDKLCIYLKSRGYTDEAIVDAGLGTLNADTGKITDRFRGRLTWEIRDVKGSVVGFGARKLFESDNGPKYLNSPQTLLYDKSRILYGLDYARREMAKSRILYLVEGYTDVMTLRAIGIDNVVAMSGTAFGEGHVALLRRVFDDVSANKSAAGKLIFVFDGDAAGQKAARRVFELEGLPHERSYGVALEEGDPDDIRQDNGDDYLKKLLTNYIPLTEYALKAEMKTHDLSTGEGRVNYVQKALEIVSSVDSSGLQEDYKRKIAFNAGVTMESLAKMSAPVRNYQSYQPSDVFDEYGEYSEYELASEDPAIRQQKICLALMFQYPLETMMAVNEIGITEDDFAEQYKASFYNTSLVAQHLIDSNEPVVLNHSDVDDENFGMEMLHYPLNIKSSDVNIAEAIKHSYLGLRRLSSQKSQAQINAQIAQLSEGVENGEADQIEALEALLKARKDAAIRRKKKKTR